MKKIKLYALTICCLFMFTECEKQLELSPLGELTGETFYQNEVHFDAATLAAYNVFLNMYWNAYEGFGKMGLVVMQDDDLMPPNGNGNEIEDFGWTVGNGQIQYLWGEVYKGIGRANTIISKLPQAKEFVDEANKARYEGEAKFIRAYWHFVAALNWDRPPVLTDAIVKYEDAFPSNSEPGEIWNAIIDDLTFAAANLPVEYNAANLGRITSGAANALLGKVYLHKAQLTNNASDYAKAIEALEAVVNSNKYSLVTNYGDNFKQTTENNAESIFEVQIESAGSGNNNQWLANDFGTPGNQDVGAPTSGRIAWSRVACGPTAVCAPRANGASIGSGITTPSLIAEIEPNDPRRPFIFYQAGDIYLEGSDLATPYNAAWSISGSSIAKYVNGTPILGFPEITDTNNERILRYADVLLMLAEAELLGNNDVAAAAGYINQVRERADPSGAILVERSSTATSEEMFEWLMHERRIELAYEGWRYYDLVRWHTAGLIDIKTDVDFGRPSANSNWQERYLWKPIPLRERDLNQNLDDFHY